MLALPDFASTNTLYTMDALRFLRLLPDNFVHCGITSPPYFGLRDYGVEGQIGLEETPAAFIDNLVAIFREFRRVLRDDGTLWVNMGDTYTGGGRGGSPNWKQGTNRGSLVGYRTDVEGLRSKNLLMMPARLAIALCDDGWYLRSEIVWSKCLSGGVRVYAQTQKGEMPMLVKELARLDPSTVKLWNGWLLIFLYRSKSVKIKRRNVVIRIPRVHRFWVWRSRKGLYECRSIAPMLRPNPAYGILFWPGARAHNCPDTVFYTLCLDGADCPCSEREANL